MENKIKTKVVELDTGCVIRGVIDGLEEDLAICYNGIGSVHVFNRDIFYAPENHEAMYAAVGKATAVALGKPVSLEAGSVILMDNYRKALDELRVLRQHLIDRLTAHHGIKFEDFCFASGKMQQTEDGPTLFYQGSIPLFQKSEGSNLYLFPSREDEVGEEAFVLDLDYGKEQEDHRLLCFTPITLSV